MSAPSADDMLAFLCDCIGSTEMPVTGRWDVADHSLMHISLMLDYALPLGIGILDPNDRYVLINAETYRILGCTSEDLKIGDPIGRAHELLAEKRLLMPDGAAMKKLTEERRHHAVDSKGRERTEVIIPFLDGTHHRLTRVKLANGYTVSMDEDVTELMESDTLLEDALNLGQSGYWIYDFATSTYTLSRSLKSIYTDEQTDEQIRKGPLVAVHPDDRADYAHAMRNIAATSDRFEITTRHAMFAHDFWYQSICQLIRNPDGSPRLLRCFVRNVTRDRKRADELSRVKDEAVAASVAKSQFLANMSHEIRTPMNGVLGMAELLAGSALDDRQREFVNVITRSATSLLTVINDILDFSKIEADALELEAHSFSLRDIVDEVTTLLSTTASEKGLELIVRYPAGQPHSFIGDGVRVRQILTNLVGNALKFTEKGHVLVEVDAVPDPSGNAFLAVSVTDTGIGIEPSKISAVFDKFTQADNSTTRIYGGTGLGLSISKRLAELMGGTLAVTSTYGEGSTFTMTVPLALDKSARPVVRNTAPLKGRRALIVDDIDVNRRVLSEQLSGWGMKTMAVSDGVEALLALKEAQDRKTAHQPFDLLVLDYLMPGVNGRELASMIHAQPAIDLPVLMLSSCDRSQNASLDGLTGVDSYLVKPVREQALFDAVLAMIYGSKAEAGRDTDGVEDTVADLVARTSETEPQDKSQDEPLAGSSPRPEAAPEPQSEPEPRSEPQLNDESDRKDRSGWIATPPPANPMQVRMSAPEIASERAGPKLEILVAEDFPLNQDVVRLMLADTRYQPVIANNGEEAVAMFTQSPANRFAAVLMDVSMPVMDGYQATEAIAAVERAVGADHVPVIALTGHALTHEREKCLEAGMDGYLTKPVKQVELIAMLDRWTGHRSKIAVA